MTSSSDLSQNSFSFDRRSFVHMGSAAMLASCARFPLGISTGPGPAIFGDAHVHLFNAADLPVRGFFENVLSYRPELENFQFLVPALVDLAQHVMKPMAKSAATELKELRSNSSIAAPEPTAGEMARRILDRAIALDRSSPAASNKDRTIADSYRQLFKAIDAAPSRPGGENALNPSMVDQRRLAQILAQGEDAPVSSEALDGFSLARLRAIVQWAFLMCLSRSHHFNSYLKKMRLRSGPPKLLVNLLVDYDAWLADGPKEGSAASDQVEFWTEFAKRNANRAQILTFAGYDPLQAALSKRANNGRYFEELSSWTVAPPGAQRRIAGFKIYPPMGFRVFANPTWVEGQSYERAAAIAARAWVDGGKYQLASLNGALDSALDEMFAFASLHDLPILAHARESNDASEGAGENAAPRHWRARIEKGPTGPYPLRALLAHYPGAEPRDDDDVRAILTHNVNGRSNVFFDIAFFDEMLEDGTAADQLLTRIQDLCDSNPTKAAYFCYGSDWIMLAQIPHIGRYADTIDKAIQNSKFWAPLRDGFFGQNLQRFLKLA